MLAAPRGARPVADSASIDRAADLLAGAARPLLLAGGGAHGAGPALADALERGVPVLTSINGKGCVDEHHPLAFGARYGLPAAHELIEDADVLLMVGTELGQADTWRTGIAPRGRVIRIDLDPAQAHGNVAAEVALIGDAGPTLAALLERAADVTADDEWLARRSAVDREAADTGRRWADVSEALEAALAPGDVLCADNAMVAYNGLLGSVRLGAGSRFLFPSGFGTLGYALPAAIGAKLGRPDRRVAAVHGDGGIMFTLPELATAAELELPLPIVVSLNGGYGEIRREMHRAGLRAARGRPRAGGPARGRARARRARAGAPGRGRAAGGARGRVRAARSDADHRPGVSAMADWDGLIRAPLREVGPYVPGSSAAEMRARYGIADLARLNWNEGLFGPLPGVLEAAAASLEDAWMYPEAAYGELIESDRRLARRAAGPGPARPRDPGARDDDHLRVRLARRPRGRAAADLRALRAGVPGGGRGRVARRRGRPALRPRADRGRSRARAARGSSGSATRTTRRARGWSPLSGPRSSTRCRPTASRSPTRRTSTTSRRTSGRPGSPTWPRAGG